MPITCLNTQATKEYVSHFDPLYRKDDAPDPKATVFSLRALDSYMEANIQSMSVSYKTTVPAGVDISTLTPDERNALTKRSTDIPGMCLEGVRLCLKGWKNFKDQAGNDIPFKTVQENIKGRVYDVIDPDLMKLIPQHIIQELYLQINMLSVFSGQEIKN